MDKEKYITKHAYSEKLKKGWHYQNFPVDATASNVPFTSSSDNISAFCKAPLKKKKITLF